jgi:hypothetical protein
VQSSFLLTHTRHTHSRHLQHASARGCDVVRHCPRLVLEGAHHVAVFLPKSKLYRLDSRQPRRFVRITDRSRPADGVCLFRLGGPPSAQGASALTRLDTSRPAHAGCIRSAYPTLKCRWPARSSAWLRLERRKYTEQALNLRRRLFTGFAFGCPRAPIQVAILRPSLPRIKA